VGIDGTEEAAEGTIRVGLNGKYLCPGLIDAHVHIAAPPSEKDLQALTKVHEHVILYRTTYVRRDILSRGFTTVRDAAVLHWRLKKPFKMGSSLDLVCRLQDTPSARQAGMVTFATPTSIRLWNVDVAKSLELREYVTESPNVCTWQGMS
jgi:imidazolonepropionase-like amidohydrolase